MTKGGGDVVAPPNRATAGLLGALDGLAEGLEENDVAEVTDRAFAQTTAVVEGIERGAHRAGWVRSGRGRRARRGPPPHPISRPMRRARRAVRHAIERTQSGAYAAAETGRRALRAPPRVVRDLKEAATSYGKGWAKGIAFYAVAGVVAIVAFSCLTAGFVIGLNILLGPPWGAFVVAGLYTVLALVFVSSAGKAIRRGKLDAMRHVGDAKQRIRDVGEPLREWRAAPNASPARRRVQRTRRPARRTGTIEPQMDHGTGDPIPSAAAAMATPTDPQVSFIRITPPEPSSQPSSPSSRSLPGAPGDNR